VEKCNVEGIYDGFDENIFSNPEFIEDAGNSSDTTAVWRDNSKLTYCLKALP
jgi:hypothetical protein